MAHRQSQRENAKTRVISVMWMLSKDRYIKAPEIIRRLELKFGYRVNRKTIYDDIRAISRIVPIEIKPGKNGGFRLMEFAWE